MRDTPPFDLIANQPGAIGKAIGPAAQLPQAVSFQSRAGLNSAAPGVRRSSVRLSVNASICQRKVAFGPHPLAFLLRGLLRIGQGLVKAVIERVDSHSTGDLILVHV
jgi:hypothetical protein